MLAVMLGIAGCRPHIGKCDPPSSLTISAPLTMGSFQIQLAKGSSLRAKSNGDRGHPCLVPLPRAKTSDFFIIDYYLFQWFGVEESHPSDEFWTESQLFQHSEEIGPFDSVECHGGVQRHHHRILS